MLIVLIVKLYLDISKIRLGKFEEEEYLRISFPQNINQKHPLLKFKI